MRESVALAPRLGLAVCLAISPGACLPPSGYAPATQWQRSATPPSPKLSRLLGTFVRQQTDASCSVASAATVINAVLASRERPMLPQQSVLDSDPTGHWERDTRNADSAGVTLDQFGLYLLRAFYAVGVRNLGVDVVHVYDTSEDAQQRLASALEATEKDPDNCFLIVNFRQSVFVARGAAIGHLSPIGAYDATAQRALVLDVDNANLQPYWVSLAVLVDGMHTRDDATGDVRGYVLVRLQP